ncbi:MAG: TrkH family potassium uptake protein [Lachnospiraceae bacterium]|jgi:trk system potassium uptake protein TrkH|nr:TrkH family potassium uptake protein [Lachnospiraceae bacterium]
MNIKMILYVLGKILGVEAILLLLPMFVSVAYGEKTGLTFIFPIMILIFCYLAFGQIKPLDTSLYGKDGMLIVALAWVLWSIIGCLPFVISGYIPSYIDAFFETVSGFTTSGSTILKDVEILPYGLQFWRLFTHWIGGMGVLVFVLVITTLEKKSSMVIMRAEVPGPENEKLVSRSMSTARILYTMYLVLTIVLTILLILGGLSIYDAVVTAFSTAGTGGFSNYNASIAVFHSVYVETVLTVFMALFGVNFTLFYLLLLKEWKIVIKNEELRVYFLIIGIATVFITIYNVLVGDYGSYLTSFRYAAFTVVSTITTTGFITDDYNFWPAACKGVLLLLMIIGACQASTGGGAKVSRFLIAIKTTKNQIRKILHPKSVNIIKMNGRKVSEDIVKGITGYLMCYLMIFLISMILFSFENLDMESTVSCILTSMNNVGPGFGQALGPTGNFASLSILSKLVLCFDMLAGRLEIFPMIILLTLPFRRNKF